MPKGTKVTATYLVSVVLFNFIFVNFYEVWKAEYWVQNESVEYRQKIIQMSQYTDDPVASIDDTKALAKVLAIPRVKGQWPFLIISSLILLILVWGQSSLRSWGKIGILVLSVLVVPYNVWYLTTYHYPLPPIYHLEVFYRVFIVIGFASIFGYLLSSKAKAIFK